MNRIRNTSQRLVEVLVFYRKKNIKLQPVTPLMPLEALLIPVNPTNSDYDGIIGGTGCNFIFSPCSLSWQDRIRLRGRTWPKGVKIYCR